MEKTITINYLRYLTVPIYKRIFSSVKKPGQKHFKVFH